MAPTLAELLDAKTAAQITTALLAQLQTGEFPTTDWNSGAPERTLIEAEANSQEDQWALVATIAGGMHVDTAEGDWLTLLAAQRYQLTRTPSVATVGTLTLTCAASAGPYTIANNTLEFKGAGGNLYTNTAGGGVLASGGTLDITITARSPGADEGNDGATTITTMTTPLAGVTCTNPASTFSDVAQTGTSTGTVTPTFGTPSTRSWVIRITVTGDIGVGKFRLSSDGGVTYGAEATTGNALVDVDSTGINLSFADGSGTPNSFIVGEFYTFTSNGTWYTTAGTDEETDAILRLRCKARWPDLSTTPTDDVYTVMCLAADPTVKKVRVAVDAVVPAQVNITIAGTNGPIGSATVLTDVQAYIDARKSLTDVPIVSDATSFSVALAGATVRVKAAALANAMTRAQANVQTYLGTCGIGDGSTVKIRHSQIVEAILRESGDEDDSVSGLTVNASGADVLITANRVAVWTEQIAGVLTWTTY